MVLLQDYEKLRLIGKGSFATVFKVRHTSLGYIRAIKVLNEMVDNEGDPSYKAFLKECRVLLKIGNGGHPNIVRIYKPDLKENKAFVEMDYVEGSTLKDFLQQHNCFLPYPEIEQFIHDIVGALAYCHVDIYKFLLNPVEDNLETDPDDGRKYLISKEKEQELIQKYRVIHNDLHSSNIMRRDYDGNYVLLDFGLSIQDNHCVKSSSRRDGALEYSAPEKWNNAEVNSQTDVYSLGVLLYELLAGQVPFPLELDKYSNEIECKNKLYHSHVEQRPPEIEPLRERRFRETHPEAKWERDYPKWLESAIMKCLAKKPEDRYQDAKELLVDIQSKQADDRMAAVTRKNEDIRLLRETIEKQRKQILRFETELTENSKEVNGSGQNNDTKEGCGQEKIEFLRAENDDLREKYSHLLEEQKANDSKYNSVDELYRTSIIQNADLTRKISHLRDANKKLQNDNTQLHGENERLSKLKIIRWVLPLLLLTTLGATGLAYYFYNEKSTYLAFRDHDYSASVYIDRNANVVGNSAAVTGKKQLTTRPPQPKSVYQHTNAENREMTKLRNENTQLKKELDAQKELARKSQSVVKPDSKQSQIISSLQKQINDLQRKNKELNNKVALQANKSQSVVKSDPKQSQIISSLQKQVNDLQRKNKELNDVVKRYRQILE